MHETCWNSVDPLLKKIKKNKKKKKKKKTQMHAVNAVSKQYTEFYKTKLVSLKITEKKNLEIYIYG